jgi:hypothetical protein
MELSTVTAAVPQGSVLLLCKADCQSPQNQRQLPTILQYYDEWCLLGCYAVRLLHQGDTNLVSYKTHTA